MVESDDKDPVRRVSIVGRLAVSPLVKLSLAGRRLVAYLALRSEPVERAQVAADLWPDVGDEDARSNLRRALWHVPRGWITSTNDLVVLDADCDLQTARGLAARALDGASLPFDAIRLLSDDILPGWHDDWLLAEQDAFRLLRLQALEAACRSMTAGGLYAYAVQAGSAALSADDLCESAADALIRAHLAQGNRGQALACFRALSNRLHSELGVTPDPTLVAAIGTMGADQRSGAQAG